MKKVFFTDLDSTIICSQEPEKFGICVAMKNGRKSSFMYNDTYNKFIKITEKIDVIPITTRCEKSYNNIYLKKFFKYALVDNGAILISEDKSLCNEWIKESRKIIKDDVVNFEAIRNIIEKYGYKEKWGSEFVLDYVNTNINENIVEKIKEEIKNLSDNLLINIGKTSIVVTYNKLSKGENIYRLAKKLNLNLWLSAGDNKEDESMFKKTELSIGKNNATFNFPISDKLTFCSTVIDKAYTLIM